MFTPCARNTPMSCNVWIMLMTERIKDVCVELIKLVQTVVVRIDVETSSSLVIFELFYRVKVINWDMEYWLNVQLKSYVNG